MLVLRAGTSVRAFVCLVLALLRLSSTAFDLRTRTACDAIAYVTSLQALRILCRTAERDGLIGVGFYLADRLTAEHFTRSGKVRE